MAATVVIYERHGTGGTLADKTSGTVRFKNAGDPTVDLLNPLVKPTSGTDYSFEKALRLGITGGSFSQITNGNVYTDGTNSFGTGVELYMKSQATYSAPVEPSGTSGYTDAFTRTSGSPLALNVGTQTGTGQIGDHAYLFMRITSAVSGGVTPSETLTFSWDEI